MGVIDAEGLFAGNRMGLLTDVARLHFPWRDSARFQRGKIRPGQSGGRPLGSDSAEGPFEGDDWDNTVYAKQHIQPINTRPDLWEAMKALPPRQFRAVFLTYWNGMSDEAVGAEMGVSRQAVDALLEKAKINLRGGVAVQQSRGTTTVRGKEPQNLARGCKLPTSSTYMVEGGSPQRKSSVPCIIGDSQLHT